MGTAGRGNFAGRALPPGKRWPEDKYEKPPPCIRLHGGGFWLVCSEIHRLGRRIKFCRALMPVGQRRVLQHSADGGTPGSPKAQTA